MKTPSFYNDADLHICFDAYSLAGIQFLELEPSDKGTHTNESIILKMCYLHEFVR